MNGELRRGCQGLMAEWQELKAALNGATSTALGMPMFPDGYIVHTPAFTHGELAYLRCITWLYVHYYELARPHVTYLASQVGAGDETGSAHLRLVRQLRTHSHHALNPVRREEDVTTVFACEAWMQSACAGGHVADRRRNRQGMAEGDWARCVFALLGEALIFMRALWRVAASIIEDNDEMALHTWRFKATHYCAPVAYNDIIRQALVRLGQNVDIRAFRDAHYNRWNRQLSTLSPDFDFATEATGLVEYALLSEPIERLPVTGEDIMVSFGIPEGRKVGDILKLAKQLHAERPNSKEELLRRLHERVDGEQ